MAIFAYLTTGDPSDWSDLYTCGGSGDYGGYCNPLVDNGFATVATDTDPGQRATDANAVDALLASDVAAIPMWARPDLLAYSTKVNGLVDNPFLGGGPFWNAQDIWLGANAAAPSITSFTPTHGAVGTTVAIHRVTGLPGATTVTFGGTPAQSYSVDSDTQVTATVASGTPTGPVARYRPRRERDFHEDLLLAACRHGTGPRDRPRRDDGDRERCELHGGDEVRLR